MNAIEMRGVQKRFDAKPVLLDLDFTLPHGTVMGLIGKNGSGKTTLLNCAMGLLKPQQGASTVYGEDSWQLSGATKHRIGFVPQQFDFCPWMRVQHMLDYVGSFYRHWDKARVQTLREKWELNPKAAVHTLSVGQKQRLAIILALGHNPDLLVLDEPVASLDPSARREFLKHIIELATEDGKSVLFSTHITSDIERVAAHVAFLRDGNIFYQGNLDELKENIVRLRIHGRQPLPKHLPIPNILHAKVEGNSALVTTASGIEVDIDALSRQLSAPVQVEHLNLEDIFLELN